MATSNGSSKVSSTGKPSTDSPGLRRSVRENAWGKQPSPISKTPLEKSDHLMSSKPSSNSRKSDRLEKHLPNSAKKKSQTVEEQEAQQDTQQETQQETPSPLRRSERSKKQTMLNPSSLKRKRMNSRTYKALFSPKQGGSSGAVKNDDLETVLEVNHGKLEEKLSSKYVEYWVPVSISTVQLEQYCALLLANSITLRSSTKELIGVLRDAIVSTHKCCDHPYDVDPSLQGLLMKEHSPPKLLEAGIKASGKFQLLDIILSEIRNKGLRVLILFKYISVVSGRYTIGDILDDYLQQRFGQDSYERVDAGLHQHRKQALVNRFNDKNSGRFVFLLETRACQSSIKLSSVDAIIIFDSDWNPSLDLRDLNRMPIDSSLKQIKIFRLYSPFTLEEKILILAAQNVTLDNSLHNINRSTSHRLLKWGASYLFKKLDLFHDADTACSDMSLESPILKDVAHEILGLLSSHDDVHMENSLIVKVKHSEGTYSKNLQLLGERELQNVSDESQLFWKNLLDGRSPKWKYPSGLLQRNRKRVNNFNQPNEALNDELDVGKKKKKTDNIPISPSPEASNDELDVVKKKKKTDNIPISPSPEASNDELDVGKKKKKKTDNIPISPSPEVGRNETEPIEKGGLELGGLQPVCGTESPKGETSVMSQNVRLLLKSNMAEVYDVLQLPDDVKIMAGDFLDYIIDNHRINLEPKSIFEAFQISLCWNAASIVKKKIYKDKSLATVRKLLKFSCTEEEANHAYSKMRDLRKVFLKHIHSLKEPKYSKDVVYITDDGPIGLPLAERGTCHLQALNVLNAETDTLIRRMKQDYAELLQNFLRLCPLEKGIESHFKKIEENYGEHLERLMLQQQEEIHDMEKDMEKKREEIDTEYRLHATIIRSIQVNHSVRADKLKKNVEVFSKRMEVHHQQKDARLRELQEKHAGERSVETKKATKKFEELKSLLAADFPGDEHVLSIGSESASCEKEKTDETSDEPKPVSNEPTTCIDDQSNIQPVNGAVGFTMKPSGSIAIDTLPGVLNRESEQQPHCSSVDNLEESNLPLPQAPDKDPSKEPSQSSSAVIEADDTNLVVIDDMRNQNDKSCEKLHKVELPLLPNNPGPIDETRGGEPGTVEMESLQQTLAGSPVVADSSTVSVQNDQDCGEDIVNADRGSSQQVSIAGSQAGVDSCNDEADLPRVSEAVDQDCGEDIVNADRGSSQQVSVAGSQAGVDSCNDEADLPRVSNVVETTTTTDNAIPTPASVIAGSNEASGFAIKPNMNICSSDQVMTTTTVQAEGSAVLLQETIQTTQTPVSHHSVNMHGPPTVQNQLSMHNRTNIVLPLNAEVLHQQYECIREPLEQLIAARGVRSLPSVSVSPLGQGTQPPILTGQPMPLNFSNHNPEVDDPLSNETDRLSKEMEKFKNAMDFKMSVLESARAKELEEINQKYNAIIHETETAISSNINQLQGKKNRVLQFKNVALCFQRKNVAKSSNSQSGSPFISNMQQFPSVRFLGRQTTDVTRTSSSPVLTNGEMLIAHAPTISNMRAPWAPHRPSLTHPWDLPHRPSLTPWAPPPHRPYLTPPTTIKRQVRGEIHAPAPNLRFGPAYSSSDHYNRPLVSVRANVSGIQTEYLNPQFTPVSVRANVSGMQTEYLNPQLTPVSVRANVSGMQTEFLNPQLTPVSVRANASGMQTEYLNPLLTPIGSIANSCRQARPIAPASFASARPVVMPTIQTQLEEVTVQAETSAPHVVVSNEVVYLSDDDDEDVGSM